MPRLVDLHTCLLAAVAAILFPSSLRAGENTVTIDADDAYLEQFGAAYWVSPDAATSIPVKLDSPSIGGGSVSWVCYENPGIGTVFFSPGQENGVVVTNGELPGLAEEFYPGWMATWAYFTFTKTTGGIVEGEPNTLYFAHVRELPPLGRQVECTVDFVCALIIFFFHGTDYCLAGLNRDSGGNDIISVLHRYRDEVLSATADGQFYTNLYVQHSHDLARAVVADRSLLIRIAKAQGPWVNGLNALVNGSGDLSVVTQQMEDELNALLDTFAAVGSPDLQQMIAFERGRLQLDQIAGLTMTGYQDQIEDLGGVTSVEPASWGRVKALYR